MPRPFASKQVLDRKLWEDGRARIAAAALPLFVRHGYHATPVRAIASAAGLSVGSIFNYFADKDELLQYILDDSQARFERSLTEARAVAEREITARGESDPVRIFITVYRRYVEYLDETRQYAQLAYQELKSLSSEGRAPILERNRRVRGLLAEAAEPAIKAGIFCPEGLELKILSLEMLAHMWILRGWAMSYGSVHEYFARLEPLALAILTAPPARH
jgi:AcrR family transcriptional regulator